MLRIAHFGNASEPMHRGKNGFPFLADLFLLFPISLRGRSLAVHLPSRLNLLFIPNSHADRDPCSHSRKLTSLH